MLRALVIATTLLSFACAPRMTTTPPVMMSQQIKTDPRFPIRGTPAPYELTGDELRIDGRAIPLRGTSQRMPEVAREFARVPRELRASLTALAVSDVPNPSDEQWARVYGLPVQAGMTTSSKGLITIYPHGFEQLDRDDKDVFARNFFHELGHAWSLRAWADPSAKQAWLDAIAADPSAPSSLAQLSFTKSGLPYEDVAEATALYFLIRGTKDEATYRAILPHRFALLDARFAP